MLASNEKPHLPFANDSEVGPDTWELDLPLVHPTYLRLLVAAAKAEGVDLDACLVPLGLNARWLSNCDEPVSLAVWRDLMLSLERCAPRPGLAIRLGRRVPLLAHGPLAYLMASASNLRQALEALVRFAPLRLAVLNVQVRERKGSLELHVRPRVALGDVERFTLDFLLAMICSMLEELSPEARRNTTLRLSGMGADIARAWAEVGVHVEGGARWPTLFVPAVLADASVPTASAEDYTRAWRACEDAERHQGWSASLRSRIEQLFRTGHAANYKLPKVAEHLGTSRRTVIRRLADEGTTFSDLVDASRKQRLMRRMSDRHPAQRERKLNLAEIAEDLGYADSAVLSRAVQRWFGLSPRELQRQVDAACQS